MTLLEAAGDQLQLQIASLGLLSLAVIPACIGAYGSLSLMKRPVTYTKKEPPRTEDKQEKAVVLSSTDAFLIPVVASVSIYVFYSLMMSLNEHLDTVNCVITYATYLLFSTAYVKTVMKLCKKCLPKSITDTMKAYKIIFTGYGKKICSMNVSAVHALVLLSSILLNVAYAYTSNWMIGNVFASCLAITVITLVSVQSFSTGYILLFGMVVYDIVWALRSNYLLDISNTLDNSLTSITWPRSVDDHYMYHNVSITNRYFTMFGLGDIIIPGIFIAFCLRFDRLQAWKKSNASSFHKPYFKAAMVAYAIGAGASILAVHVTKEPQSAMVFINPLLILSSLLVAASKGELDEMRDMPSNEITYENVSFEDEDLISESDEDYLLDEGDIDEDEEDDEWIPSSEIHNNEVDYAEEIVQTKVNIPAHHSRK
ncbi:signal peptide peptidase-domain-containing protein [Pilobolus umbonatus]|nr:signal peptide peptidase-domain-containing protein [Pilobolus umbonatus]